MISLSSQYTPTAITVSDDRGTVIVSVAGDLDRSVADMVRHRFSAALTHASSGLILDLTAVTLCPAAILRVLLDVMAAADSAGVGCVIVAGQRAVRRPVALTGLTSVLHPLPSLPAAQAWLADRRAAGLAATP